MKRLLTFFATIFALAFATHDAFAAGTCRRGIGTSAYDDDCTAGYFCNAGDSARTCTAIEADSDRLCGIGFFCPKSSTLYTGAPTIATSGCPTLGTNGNGQCPCEAGFFCPAGSTDPRGYPVIANSGCNYSQTNVAGRGNCVCRGDTFSNANATGCSLCPTGYGASTAPYNATNAACVASCAAGQYVSVAQATCGTVGAGYWSATNDVNYGGTSGRTQCPENYRSGPAATSENNCKPANCSAGQWWNGTTQACETCSGAYWCAGATTVTYGTRTTSVGRNACPSATGGWTQGTGSGWSAVTDCFRTSTPANCTGGTVKQNAIDTGAWGSSVKETPLYTNRGYYVSGGTSCVACAAGTFQPNDNTAAASCTDCKQGSFSTGTANSACTPCNGGKTNANDGQTSCTGNCTAIDGLYSWATPVWNGNNTITNLCTVNLCNPGRYKNGNACPTCAAGTYNGAANDNPGCSDCGAGKFTDNNINCLNCANGSFSDNAKNSKCTACPGGKTNGGTGNDTCGVNCGGVDGLHSWENPSWTNNTTANLCTTGLCVPGRYKNGNLCPKCAAGTFTDKPNDASSCDNCAAGTFGDKEGATSAGDCKSCPGGTTTKPGDTKITDCHIPRTAVFRDGNGNNFTFGQFMTGGTGDHVCFYNPPPP